MKDGIVGIRHRLHNTDRCVGEQNAPVERLTEQLNVVLQRGGSALGERGLQQDSAAMEVGLERVDVDGVGHYRNKGGEGLDAFNRMIPSLQQLMVAMVVFVLIDSVWLLTAGQYALAMTQRIQGSIVVMNLAAAFVVYIALGYLVYQVKSVQEAGLLGAAVYAVYDFTSLAILKKYEWTMAVADTVWGSVLFAAVFSVLKYFHIA